MRSLALLSCAALVHALPSEPEQSQASKNSNHIFNAIHSSMRQFGSSLNHNGMSLFIANVPADTEFYHGTRSATRVNGIEWLAFEPEHALRFAEPPPRGPHGPPAAEASEGHDAHAEGNTVAQKPIFPPASETGKDADVHGYLHTYRTKHALRLLYVDGQSAAKSAKGTLDLQDLVLLHHAPPIGGPKPPEGETSNGQNGRTSEHSLHSLVDRTQHERARTEEDITKPHGPMGEASRAIGLCRVAEEEWQGKIDGVLRMEHGFEIILCDFAKHLDVVHILQTQDQSDRGPGSGNGKEGGEEFQLFKAIAARYDGIGGGRVMIDYDNFVTLYAFEDAMFRDKDDLPRVRNVTTVVEPVRTAVKDMALAPPSQERISKDWQAVADMIVSRYADRIAYLASGSLEDVDSFHEEVGLAIMPFLDFANRSREGEIARCTAQVLPAGTGADSDTLAARAVFNVSNTICRTLSAGLEIDTVARGVSLMRDLQSWLGWTVWKKCRGCGVREVCFVPIWPMGKEKYFEHPECLSDLSKGRGGYWGHLSQ